MKTLRDHLIEKYNTYNRRPTAFNEKLRERMFKAYSRILSKWLPQDKSAAILDVACGEGTLLSYLWHHGYRNIHGFDLSPENVRICQQLGLNFVKVFDAMEISS